MMREFFSVRSACGGEFSPRTEGVRRSETRLANLGDPARRGNPRLGRGAGSVVGRRGNIDDGLVGSTEGVSRVRADQIGGMHAEAG
jgi:hypothetical protein